MEQTMKMMNIPYNNYKTQTCKYYEKDKSCKFGANCSFAHGGVEMRNPYDNLPPIMPSTAAGGPDMFSQVPDPFMQAPNMSSMMMSTGDVKMMVTDMNDVMTKQKVVEAASLLQQGLTE